MKNTKPDGIQNDIHDPTFRHSGLVKYVKRMHVLLHNGAGWSFDSTNLNLSGDHSAEMVSSGVTEPDMLVSSMQNVSQAA